MHGMVWCGRSHAAGQPLSSTVNSVFAALRVGPADECLQCWRLGHKCVWSAVTHGTILLRYKGGVSSSEDTSLRGC